MCVCVCFMCVCVCFVCVCVCGNGRTTSLMFYNYTQALWNRLMKGSSKDIGTFGYFCSLLGCLHKARQPKKDMNACIDVLFTVLKGHYVAYACKLLGINNCFESSEIIATINYRDAKCAFLAKSHSK